MELRNFIANNVRESLNEQRVNIKVPKPNKSFLYHGSNIKNLENIKNDGLIPSFGETVKGTEAYAAYMDDDYYNSENKVEGVLFFVLGYSNTAKPPTRFCNCKIFYFIIFLTLKLFFYKICWFSYL
jgi:hypothetical protein